MRFLVHTILTIGLAALLVGCGGSKKEDTMPASTEAAPAEGEAGAEGGMEGEGDDSGAAGDEDEGAEPKAEDESGGGW
jgi:hypothetical protein